VRRRLYLMRHAAVAYFDENGNPRDPNEVPLTAAGVEQARAAAAVLAGVTFDRVLTSGLPRTIETAQIVAPDAQPEVWPELAELRGGRLSDIPEDELEAVITRAFHGVVPREARFLGGETIGALLDRVVPAVERFAAEPGWDTALAVLHGGVNRAILSFALTGERRFLGGLEQAPACLNVLDVGEDWIVRAVNTVPYDLVHASGRLTTMEELFRQYRPLQ
jgi:broad specificity phosphatase PhoE